MISVICASTNGCVISRDTGNFRRHRAHYDIAVMNHILFPLLDGKKFRVNVFEPIKIHYKFETVLFYNVLLAIFYYIPTTTAFTKAFVLTESVR